MASVVRRALILPCPHCGAPLRAAVDDARLRRLGIEARCRRCDGRFDVASLLSVESSAGAAPGNPDDLGEDDGNEGGVGRDDTDGDHDRNERPTVPEAPSSRRAGRDQEQSLLGRVPTMRALVPRRSRSRWTRPLPTPVPEGGHDLS